MNGVNVALLAAALLVLVLFSRRSSAAAVAAPSPSKPVDTGVKPGQFYFPPSLYNFAGSTITGTADAPVQIKKASITESDFTGMLKPGTTVQLAPGTDAVDIACLGSTYRMGIGGGSISSTGGWCRP